MQKYKLQYKPFGKEAILIEWPSEVDDKILEDVLTFTHKIKTAFKEELINCTSAYNSILVHFKFNVDFQFYIDQLHTLYITKSGCDKTLSKTWFVPVCYDQEFGLDLIEYVKKGIQIEDLIKMHTKVPYRVFMIGFLPGFIYLGGLQEELHLPRKQNPRPKILKGSVGIGGKQGGIYPMDSPGGWQIIGRTPINLFDIDNNPPCEIKQGDYIQFQAIDKSTFIELKKVSLKNYQALRLNK